MQKRMIRFCLVLGLCVCLAGLSGCFEAEDTVSYQTGLRTAAETAVLQETAAETKEKIVVHVCGAVKMPGVYEFEAGSRVYQAVEAAGGFLAEAQTKAVNLADILTDGRQIWIPAEGESEAEPEAAADRKVSINRAEKEELMELPGIGESRAEAIIAYRTEHGNFLHPEDIMLVPGIKEAAYAKLKDRITAD